MKSWTWTRRGALKATRRRIAPVAVVVLGATVITTGTAYAFWTATGSGQGPAAAATALTALTTTAADPSGPLLYPGSAKTDLVLTIHNPGTLTVRVTGVVADTSQAITSTGAGGTCTVTGITLDPSVTTIDLTPGATITRTLSGVVSMSAAADSGCQHATFAIPVLLNGRNL